METYSLNKETAMPDVLNYDTPIRPIKPADKVPSPADRLPVPAAFMDELRNILGGLLGR